ncbi:sigma-70 family RNA polymerase sigma factor [Priestia megaterium]|uniref:sigma-70 family RNA polymerase sigma factor n=1 Tax=Priestia megaterium TaxID=1404 RepID=UPI003671164E
MSFYKKGINQKTFEHLIENEKSKLYRMAYLYVRNENDALDVVQEAIYKAFISLTSLKEPSYFSTWMTRILINTALDFIKKKKSVVPISPEKDFGDEKTENIEDKVDLINAIKRLEEPQRTAIILRYYKDFTVKQIAEILNCPDGTVKTHLHRAIGKLKIDLKEGYMK